MTEEDDGAGDDALWCCRLVDREQFEANPVVAPTGLHLALLADDCSGRSAEELARWWGYDDAEIAARRNSGRDFLVVLYAASERVGWATVEGLARLLSVGGGDFSGKMEDIAVALSVAPASAEALGLGETQRRLAGRLGVVPAVFGGGRIRFKGQEDGLVPRFVLDEKLKDGVEDPLAEGSALPVAEFPELPVVVVAPWREG
jgi:hypothetical protein